MFLLCAGGIVSKETVSPATFMKGLFMIIIRDATLEDAGSILEIYSYYVECTAISFELKTPTIEEFRQRMREIKRCYPYLVVVKDGHIEGFAYAHLFVGRDAYRYSAETTIYLRYGSQGAGLGKTLYAELENRLKQMGIINLYACIGVPNEEDKYLTNNSMDFHSHIGYKTVGVFKNCGRKFNKWYSMVWMEKLIGVHTEDPIH